MTLQEKREAIRNYRKQCLQVMWRKYPYCHYCGILTILHKDMSKYSKGYELWHRLATIDHKVPQSKGGKERKENFVLACHKCNVEKGNRYTYRAFLTLKREEIKP